MANLGQTYTAGDETMGDRDALPAGEYIASIVKSDVVSTKSGDGKYIKLEFEVQDGAASGRRFWTNLNLWNKNAQAVEIAQRELNSICHAVGRLSVADTEELHGIPMRVKLKVKVSDQYGPGNETAGYKHLNAGASPSGPSTAANGTSAAGGERRGPWGN